MPYEWIVDNAPNPVDNSPDLVENSREIVDTPRDAGHARYARDAGESRATVDSASGPPPPPPLAESLRSPSDPTSSLSEALLWQAYGLTEEKR